MDVMGCQTCKIVIEMSSSYWGKTIVPAPIPMAGDGVRSMRALPCSDCRVLAWGDARDGGLRVLRISLEWGRTVVVATWRESTNIEVNRTK